MDIKKGILAFVLVSVIAQTSLITAIENKQSSHSKKVEIERAKSAFKTFRNDMQCMFSKKGCTREQKIQLITHGVTLLAVIALLTTTVYYYGWLRLAKQQREREEKKRLAKEKTRKKREARAKEEEEEEAKKARERREKEQAKLRATAKEKEQREREQKEREETQRKLREEERKKKEWEMAQAKQRVDAAEAAVAQAQQEVDAAQAAYDTEGKRRREAPSTYGAFPWGKKEHEALEEAQKKFESAKQKLEQETASLNAVRGEDES